MSRTLNVSYIRPVKVEEEVDVLNEVVSVGKNLGEFFQEPVFDKHVRSSLEENMTNRQQRSSGAS